jgi:hypothetical protein
MFILCFLFGANFAKMQKKKTLQGNIYSLFSEKKPIWGILFSSHLDSDFSLVAF